MAFRSAAAVRESFFAFERLNAASSCVPMVAAAGTVNVTENRPSRSLRVDTAGVPSHRRSNQSRAGKYVPAMLIVAAGVTTPDTLSAGAGAANARIGMSSAGTRAMIGMVAIQARTRDPAETRGGCSRWGVGPSLSHRFPSQNIVEPPFGNPASSGSSVALRPRLATGVLFRGSASYTLSGGRSSSGSSSRLGAAMARLSHSRCVSLVSSRARCEEAPPIRSTKTALPPPRSATRTRCEPAGARLDALWAPVWNNRKKRASLLPERRAGARRRSREPPAAGRARENRQRARSPRVGGVRPARAIFRHQCTGGTVGDGSPSERHSTDDRVLPLWRRFSVVLACLRVPEWTSPSCHGTEC